MKRRIILISALLVFALVSPASAAEMTVMLKPGPDGKGASGTAVIRDKAGMKEVAITMSGLKPDAVYTVWLVNKGHTGLGKPDYDFKADSKGNAVYAATIAREEIEKWEGLDIVRHPDGNPKNMKNIKSALKGELKKPAAGGY